MRKKQSVFMPSRSDLLQGIYKYERMLRDATNFEEFKRVYQYGRLLLLRIKDIPELHEDYLYVWRIGDIRRNQLKPIKPEVKQAPSGAVVELTLKEIK